MKFAEIKHDSLDIFDLIGRLHFGCERIQKWITPNQKTAEEALSKPGEMRYPIFRNLTLLDNEEMFFDNSLSFSTLMIKHTLPFDWGYLKSSIIKVKNHQNPITPFDFKLKIHWINNDKEIPIDIWGISGNGCYYSLNNNEITKFFKDEKNVNW